MSDITATFSIDNDKITIVATGNITTGMVMWRAENCPKCNKHPTEEGHDACIANLPNVLSACCGHGDIRNTYVEFSNYKIKRNKKAVRFFQRMKGDNYGKLAIDGR